MILIEHEKVERQKHLKHDYADTLTITNKLTNLEEESQE
jgi:hypothetical protein